MKMSRESVDLIKIMMSEGEVWADYSPPTCRAESSLVVAFDLEEELIPVTATPTGLF